MSQLTADCLNEIFEYLKDDKVTLYSCISVNRLWCEISVRFFWSDIKNYNTLIACLPCDLKEILYKKLIIIFQYQNISFTSYPGAKECLKNLSELHCSSNISSEFFYQLSEICHNISLIDITFKKVISNGLVDFISVQKNLKYFSLITK